jgi:arginyl-tRNA synthetase
LGERLKEYLTTEINSALKKIGIESAVLQFDKPKDEKFGDLSANIAMMLAKELETSAKENSSGHTGQSSDRSRQNL